MKRGFFITFEGPEGAGKSSQIVLLREWLEAMGFSTLLTREPGGTPLAEQLRTIVKHFDGPEVVAPETETLLFAAARAQHVRQLIEPALAAGKIVICDRFFDSTEAYQGVGRAQNQSFLRELRSYVCGDVSVDLTILIDLPVELGLARAAARRAPEEQVDRLEQEDLTFHHRVRDAFLAIARRDSGRVVVVNGDDTREHIFEQIRTLVAARLRACGWNESLTK